MAYGLTSAGFTSKPLAVVKAELEAAFREVFGDDVNLDPREPLGQIIGIIAEREADIWDLLEDVYRSADPDANEGDAQDAICAITGTVRRAATRTRVTATITGSAGTPVPSTFVVSTPAGHRFRLTAGVAIGGGGTATGVFDAEETGPVPATAGTLTRIETPVVGVTQVTNATDGVVGRAVETAEELRVRREEELRVAGGSALEAVREDVARVEGVVSCTVFENVTAAPVDGIPAKAIEVLVQGGNDAAIRQAIWASKAGGIEAHGSVTGTVTDSQGFEHTVKFSRPTAVDVYLDVDIRIVADDFPVNGDDQVKARLLAKTYRTSEDVVAWSLKKLVDVAGVFDVPTLRVGTAQWPATEATLAITARQIAVLDSTRIRVNHV